VGWSLNSSNYHAFSWTLTGGMTDLGTHSGNYSYATAVNDLGQAVGISGSHAFSWTPAGGMTDLGALGGNYSYAMAVSGSGQAAGPFFTVDGYTHVFSWTAAGGMVDIGTLGGASSSFYGMNSLGQVVGYSTLANNNPHAFSWTLAGGMVDLGTLGGSESYAADVSATGQVVGSSADSSGYRHAFSWTSASGMSNLGTLGGSQSFATAINSLGWIVGHSDTGAGGDHAFVWTSTDGMVDLNTLIPTAPPGLELYLASAISDNGSIVAYSNVGLVLLVPGILSTAAPSVGPISANDPVAIGQPANVSANFTDADTADTHTATWTWADNSAQQTGTLSESGGSGTVTGTHTFSAAGVYPVSLMVTDNTGRSAQVQRDVVVYDPSAGFVTGGGWITSPPGAYKPDTSLAGRATFGFVSKYQKGATVPTGTTAFEFRAANLSFYSNSYQWLVIGGARAQYKGTGTINGAGSYQFLLTAIDGDLLGNGKSDRFRIKIWHYDDATKSDVVDYDNQLDSSTIGGNGEGTAIGGGSIVIHK
jgi:probable HAF family extracellular repeat protein